MNYGQVARLLAGFLVFFTALFAVPLVVALFETSTGRPMAAAFGFSMLAGLGASALLWFAGRGADADMFRRDGLAIVGTAWICTGALAALPFVWSGAIPSFVDAFFECISGLTTTGATVLGTDNVAIDSLPRSLLLWRSMIQWIGGIGIILVFIVILPAMGVAGSRLVSSEQVGDVSDEGVRPSMTRYARTLFFIYTTLTVCAGVSYWIAGLGPFDATCHALTTVSTGGFSTHNASVGGFQLLAVELVAIVFMFLGSCNFLLMARVLFSRVSNASAVSITEFRTYALLTVVMIVLMSLTLWVWGQPTVDANLQITHDYDSLGRCLRDASFQTVSLLTSTGYGSANFQEWPKPALFLLITCMVIGGCTGSTAGGFKVLRVVICVKLVAHALRGFVRPRAIESLKVGSESIPAHAIQALMALLVMWLLAIGAGTLVLTLEPGVDLISAFTASVSMMGCMGPSISGVTPVGDGTFALIGSIDLGPYGGYGELSVASKLFLSVQMIFGRLEILAPLALFAPGLWRRH